MTKQKKSREILKPLVNNLTLSLNKKQLKKSDKKIIFDLITK